MTQNPQQWTAEDMRRMSPEEVVAAHKSGRLNTVLGLPEQLPTDGQLTADDMSRMTPEQIVTAHEAGRLDALLDPTRLTENEEN